MRRPLLTALLLLLAAAGHVGAGDHPWDNKRIYYIIEYQGKLREKGYFVRRPGSYQRQPCVIIEEEKASFSPINDQMPVRLIKIKTISTPGGAALQRSEEVVGGDTGRETITVEAGEAEFVSSGYFGPSARVPVSPGAMFEISGEWLAAQVPAKGKSFTAVLIDRERRCINHETVTILEQLPGRDPTVWLAEFAAEGRSPLLARFTSDGRLTRLESEGLVYQVVSREEYEQGRIAKNESMLAQAGYTAGRTGTLAGQTSTIHIGETIPAWDNFAWLVLQATPPDRWQPMLSTSDYAQVDFTGFEMRITALRNAPRVDSSAMLPMAVTPDVGIYLMPSGAVPSTSQAVIDAAYAAVSDSETRREETNALTAVSYLAGWINQNIALDDWRGYNSSALDALAERRGDSLAHARLFAAMARSLGIPARLCQGFLAYTGSAVHHCWAEVWINGGWIPVDTTVSRVGLPAGYVMSERADPDGTFGIKFAEFMREPGLGLTLISAGRETPGRQLAELVVGNRRTYAYSEGGWMANLYWGFALRLPPAWTGSAKLNSVEIASADRQASVKCEALAGDYGAGKQELDSNIASLRSNLQRFKLIDSRIVSFDAGGSTPAMFIDFSCVQDGNNLRCRQYVLPRRHRAFRLSFWAPAATFNNYVPEFDSILASFEY